MPLIKSKSKKAFSENVRTEMHNGKPQKQALAIAYSNMRKYGHKMADGGMCNVCGKECKYAGGGKVDAGLSDEEKRKARSERHPVSVSGGPGRNESRHGRTGSNALERGVSTSWSEGKSLGHHEDEVFRSGASARKTEARDNLKDLKQMPNPKLQGLDEGGTVQPIKLDPDKVQSFVKGFTGKAEGGEIEDQDPDNDGDAEIHEAIGKEIMDAHKAGDHKAFTESLKALISMCK